MDLLITSLAARPDLASVFDEFAGAWPEFMYHDPVTEALFEPLLAAHPGTLLIAVDPAEPGRPAARACSVPYGWTADPADGLPPGGYDHVILSGSAALAPASADGGGAVDAARTAAGSAEIGGAAGGGAHRLAAALEITIRPDLRGTGLSGRMLGALRDTLAAQGFTGLVAPVRPNHKHRHPTEPMSTYLARRRPDGLPEDPWLRTHVRAGASVVGIAPASMTVTAPLARWRQWTGLPFDTDGPVIVPEALVPVRCDLAAGIAVYVEPNVWVHHRLTP